MGKNGLQVVKPGREVSLAEGGQELGGGDHQLGVPPQKRRLTHLTPKMRTTTIKDIGGENKDGIKHENEKENDETCLQRRQTSKALASAEKSESKGSEVSLGRKEKTRLSSSGEKEEMDNVFRLDILSWQRTNTDWILTFYFPQF